MSRFCLGKCATAPLLAAANKIDLPFCTTFNASSFPSLPLSDMGEYPGGCWLFPNLLLCLLTYIGTYPGSFCGKCVAVFSFCPPIDCSCTYMLLTHNCGSYQPTNQQQLLKKRKLHLKSNGIMGITANCFHAIGTIYLYSLTNPWDGIFGLRGCRARPPNEHLNASPQ